MKIGNVAKVQGGYAFKSSEFMDQGVPIIKIGNLDGEKVIVDKEICYPERFWNEHPEFRINKDDILVAMSGATVGKIGVYEDTEKALLNQRIGNIIPNQKVLKAYLYYYCMSPVFRRNIEENAFGCAQPNISAKQIEEFSINVPSRDEQKKVVKVLEKIYSVIRNRKAQIKLFEDLIKSRFIEMFGDPVQNPLGWKLKPFLECGSCKNGMNFSADESGVELQYLGVGDFNNLTKIDDVISLGKVSLNQMPGEEYILQDGDIVFVRSNGNKALVGRCLAVYPHGMPTTYSGFCIRYRKTDESIEIPYLLQVLKTDSMRLMMAGRGANIQNLNQQILGQLRIPVPPIELQIQFSQFMKAIDKLKFAVQKSLDEVQLLFDSLMQKYFG